MARLDENDAYSIITDHIGTPVEAYNSIGKKVWERELEAYGKIKREIGEINLIPFQLPGQYFDIETGLCNQRYRYFSPDIGAFISKDPIGLAGGNPTMYGFVFDSNTQTDVFGLDLHHIIPQQIYKQYKTAFDAVNGYVQNISKKAADVSNLIDLDKPFHGNHPKYNDYVRNRVKNLVDMDNLNLKNIRKLQDEMLEHIANAKKSGMKLNDYFKKGLHLKNIACK